MQGFDVFGKKKKVERFLETKIFRRISKDEKHEFLSLREMSIEFVFCAHHPSHFIQFQYLFYKCSENQCLRLSGERLFI